MSNDAILSQSSRNMIEAGLRNVNQVEWTPCD